MPNSSGIKLVENLLRVVCAVVTTHARMVAAHDEMGAAVVLPDHGMEDRLSGAGISHCRRQRAKQHAVGRIVVFQ